MRIVALSALAIITLVATGVGSRDAHAVIYCTGVGIPRGCVVRPVVRAPVVVVAPASPTVVYCKTVGVPKGCVVRR